MRSVPECPFGRDIIKQYIPHRPPMLFLDHVIALDTDHIVVESVIDPSQEFFKGHFPKSPIMPGVLLVETAAQTGALLVAVQDTVPDGKFLAFTQVTEAKFKRAVYPNETIRVDVKIVKSRRGLYKFEGCITSSGTPCVTLGFNAALMEFNN